MSIISYNQLIQMFKDFATAHPFLNDFGNGPTSEISTTRQMKFPYLWITHRNASDIVIQNKTQIPEMVLTFIIVDQINDQLVINDINGDNTDNQQEILSDTFQILQDLVDYISTQLGQFGVGLTEQTVSADPVYDETTDRATGWVSDIRLRLKHSNCVTPLGDIVFTVPGTSNISLRYLTCDTLNNCDTFTQAIDNLQTQIDNLVTGDVCDILSGCTTIQLIQQDITNIEEDIANLELSATTFNSQINTLQLSATTQQQQINNIISSQSNFYIAVNYESVSTFTYVAPETFRVDSITNPSGLTLTTLLNGSPYTTGNTINYLDTLTILPNTTGFIKLNCTLL